MLGKKTWNKGLTAETDIRMATAKERSIAAQLGKPNNFAGREHSQKSKDAIASRLRGNTNGIHRGTKGAVYKTIKMDSMWEVAVAGYLDRSGEKWQYSPDAFMLSETKSYRPDFKVGNGYIEVKGYWRKNNKEKFELFRQMYPEVEIQVWHKEDLLQRGLITKAGYAILGDEL